MEAENSTVEIVYKYVIKPFIRGLSFGVSHYLTFAVIGPFLFKKIIR